MIELIILNYLQSELGVPVYMTEPECPPDLYIRIQKTGSGVRNKVRTATFAIQSYGNSLLDAAVLSDRVVKAMLDAPSMDEISSCDLNSEYNFTDTQTRRFRYQAVFDLVYFF